MEKKKNSTLATDRFSNASLVFKKKNSRVCPTQSTLPPLLARDTAICILLLDFLDAEGLVVSFKRERTREKEDGKET